MALNEAVWMMTPLELIKTLGTSSDLVIIVASGAPDGNSAPQSDAAKGSLYVRDDASTDETALYVKVDSSGSDDDWAAVLIAGEAASGGREFGTSFKLTTDKKLYFRDSGIYLYSSADGVLHLVADGSVRIGDGTNEAIFAPDGEITLAGTAKVTRAIPLGLDSQHGTATNAEFKGVPSITLDADAEEWFLSFEAPNDWDAASDLTLVFMVANEIAETDGDDVSFTCQVRGYADGETVADAGQTVTATLNLTGGTEAIDIVNRVTGAIDWNHGTYPVAAGDTIVVKSAVNLAGAGECTGPLHVIEQRVEYTAGSLGTAT